MAANWQQLVVVVLFAATTTSVVAQADSGTENCTTALAGLYPCLGFITTNTTEASASCCSNLDVVVRSEPLCLCLLLDGNFTLAGVNETKALDLPKACDIDTASPDACKTLAVGGNSTTPTNGTQADPGTGTKDSQPEEEPHRSLAKSKMSFSSLLFALSIVSYSVFR